MDRVALLLITAAYAVAIFAYAFWAQRRRARLERSRLRVPAYAIALGVYCTSWTYFGAVGSAASDGWSYLPIYLGPMLLFLLAPAFLRRLIVSVREEGATSLSDFIGARFGRSRGVAALVTVLALMGTVPYLALQLISVGASYRLVSGGSVAAPSMLIAAACLALFAILFGTRRYEVAARNEAVLYAVSIESMLKLLALCAVAGFAVLALLRAPAGIAQQGLAVIRHQFAVEQLDVDFAVTTLLAMMAIICLPRQFYVAVMEAREPDDIVRARWPFGIYLLLTSLAVLPITAAGLVLLPEGYRPDYFVLSLPLTAGADALTLFVFLGGLSAAAAMGVTESIALSTMISNDLVAPFLLRRRGGDEDRHLGRTFLHIRRAAIAALMAAAASYALLLPAQTQLASLGLVAFVAMAQTAPALFLAVRRPGNDAVAAKAGLLTGLLLWVYTLFLPAANLSVFAAGTLLDPYALFGLHGLSPIAHGTLWSLGGNLLAFAIVHLARPHVPRFAWRPLMRTEGGISTRGELIDLVARFVGREAGAQAFLHADRNAPVDRASARTAERLIAAVIGASSARAIVASALSGGGMAIGQVAQLLDASGQSLRFSQGLLAATLENIEPGVSVVDRDLRLVAWNSRYLELFDYPVGMVHVGAPIAALIRFNAERGDCGPGEVEDHVHRRLGHMRQGRTHSFERRRPDGRVLKTVGGPMPDGGYVMCFTDITAEAQARVALERARTELEDRVAARTAELRDANARLAGADADKTRFLAAASHDLLQPLHAARLFAAGLRRQIPENAAPTLDRLDRSIEAANELLRALLDISKLDAGGIVPEPSRFALRPLLEELVEGFEPLAAQRCLRLRLGGGDAWVETDRTLLRSIIQNFLSNALRYTERGGVLLALRRRGDRVRIEVYDSGPGIPADKQRAIFREFERLDHGAPGIGLGLAIVERTAPLIGGHVELRSTPGRGSRFTLALRRVEEGGDAPGPRAPSAGEAGGRTVLVVDDDPMICQGTRLLLEAGGYAVRTTFTPDQALGAVVGAETALVDFDLGAETDGLALIEALRARSPGLRVALVTAQRQPGLALRAAAMGVPVLLKPLDPALLEEWLAQEQVAVAAP